MAFDAAAWADAQPSPPAPYDCLLVLAGGVDDTGVPHPAVQRRLDAAAELYRRALAARGCSPPAIICNGGGTSHKPRWTDAAGFAVAEAQLMADGLVARGVPRSSLYLEALSDDTLGNAFAARTLHTEWRRWRNLLVITSDFQLPRAEAVYTWLFSLPPAPADAAYRLTCAGVSDEGTLPEEALAARRAREAASLVAFTSGTGARITSMAQAQEWLFTAHGAYAPRAAPREAVDPKLLASY